MKNCARLVLLLMLTMTACSESNREQPDEGEYEAYAQPDIQEQYNAEQADASTPKLDCPGFEALLAMLPTELHGESIEEQYVDCDSVAPKVSSHFIGPNHSSMWTFSVTSRNVDVPYAKPRWDIAGATEQMKTSLRTSIENVINLEALMFDNCKMYVQKPELPDWHVTHLVTVASHEVCVGTDAQAIDQAGWIARAQTPDHLYTLQVTGERATRFQTAKAASEYMAQLFAQFR